MNTSQEEQLPDRDICKKEQHWGELKLEDKIERLRSFVKEGLNYREKEISKLRSDLSICKALLGNHIHDSSGKPAVSIKDIPTNSNQVIGGVAEKRSSSNPNEVYI